jgi:hypothetical protein
MMKLKNERLRGGPLEVFKPSKGYLTLSIIIYNLDLNLKTDLTESE